MNGQAPERVSITRLAIKVILLLCIFNFGFIFINRIPYGKLSLYNIFFTGRDRLPFGENPQRSFNITMSNIDAMISSHAANRKNSGEYRVFIIGDSSVWGILQQPQDTLSGLISHLIRSENNERDIGIYNFGYPSLSVLKDLLILDEIKSLDPDLIIWMVTLESIRSESQLETPLVVNNPEKVNAIIESYGLEKYDPLSSNIMDHTLINQRRNLADIIRLQLFGVMWSATGIDQDYPESYTAAMWDLDADKNYYGITPNSLKIDDLSIEIIKYGIQGNGNIDFIIINEPILISQGMNSDIRYNFYYPRWVYDQYRDILHEEMTNSGIEYYDFWNLVPGYEFTNSAIHLNENGEAILAKEIKKIIESRFD